MEAPPDGRIISVRLYHTDAGPPHDAALPLSLGPLYPPFHRLFLQQGRRLAAEPDTEPLGRGVLKTFLDQLAENPRQPRLARRPPPIQARPGRRAAGTATNDALDRRPPSPATTIARSCSSAHRHR
jgi:hypothetical protein